MLQPMCVSSACGGLENFIYMAMRGSCDESNIGRSYCEYKGSVDFQIYSNSDCTLNKPKPIIIYNHAAQEAGASRCE